MATLAQAKTLGGIGSILVVLSFIPYAGPVLGIVGFVLTLIAVKYISDSIDDKSIFNNMIVAVILGIIGLAIGALVVFASIFRFIGLGFLSGEFGPSFQPSELPPGDIIGFIAALAIGLVLFWIFFLISAIFLRRSYNSIAARLNVGMFRTAALIYLIGAALAIILVGFILIFVAEILQIVAFFSIPEQAP
ncbi:MAG: DUF996 domain-containing protein [Nitrososphaeria archaeon]|nr:DUF996 domain-containing protein [Nitrososphaeria archaeon]NIQ33388.1 DUF996 domain-containing protein [Nitrososphaeria archaeon]